MTQAPLPIATHRNDPWTSRAAVEKHTDSGVRERNIAVVLKAIKQSPGLPADDLADITGLDVYEVRRRCSDLKNLRVIKQGTAVKRRGRAVMTWWIRESGTVEPSNEVVPVSGSGTTAPPL